MLIEKSLQRCGLTMQGDTLPKKDRKIKTFQRLIAAMRATEAEVIDQLTQAEHELNKVLREKQELQDHCHQIENELRLIKLRERLGEIESLTVDQRTKLLEYSNGNSSS